MYGFDCAEEAVNMEILYFLKYSISSLRRSST